MNNLPPMPTTLGTTTRAGSRHQLSRSWRYGNAIRNLVAVGLRNILFLFFFRMNEV